MAERDNTRLTENEWALSNLEEKWKRLAETVDSKDRDLVGLCYLRNILRIHEDGVHRFINGDSNAKFLVTQRMVEMPPDRDNWRFWWELDSIFPRLYTPKEWMFLMEDGGDEAVETFLKVMTCWVRRLDQTSPVLARINIVRSSGW